LTCKKKNNNKTTQNTNINNKETTGGKKEQRMGSVTKRYTALQALAALMTAVQLATIAHGLVLERPPVIKLGMYYNMSNPDISFDGVQLYAGAQAAVKELNDLQTVPGVTFELEYIPAATVSVENATSSVFAMVASDWYSSAPLVDFVKSNTANNVSVIGARNLLHAAYDNASRAIVSMRQPLSSEYLMIIHNAMNSELTRSSAFVAVTRSTIDLSVFSTTLASLGLPAPMEIPLGSGSANVAAVLNTWIAGDPNNGNFVPTCGVFFTTQPDAVHILEAMYTDARFNMSQMRFYVVGPAAEGVWNATSLSASLRTAPFTNVRFVTQFPDPESPTNPLALRYRTSLSSWLANTSTVLPTDFATQPLIRGPTYAGFEAYIAVRALGEVLALMPDINQTLFLQSLYRRRFLWLNDLTVGPFADRCLVDSTSSLSCFCNVGMPNFQIGRISPTTGRQARVPYASYYDPNVAVLSLPLDQCFLARSNLKFPLSFAMWYETLQVAMKAMSYHYNSDTSKKIFASATSMPAIMLPKANESLLMFEERLYATRRPVIIIGNMFPSIHHALLNMYVSPTTAYQEVPLTEATQFSRYTWLMKPFLADVVHAVSLNIAEYYATRATPIIFVASDSSVGFTLAVQSLNTVQFAVEDGAASNISDLATMAHALNAAVEVAKSGRDVVFFVSTVTGTVAVNAVNAAAAMTAALEGTAAGSAVFAHLTLAIATDQNNLNTAKFQMANRTARPYFPIFFGSYLYPFWEPGNANMAAAAAIMSGSTQAVLESMSVHASYMLFALFTTAAEQSAVQPPTSTSITDHLYEQSFLTAAGVTIGPIYDANCTADVIAANEVNRKCQCFKILRTLNVYDYRDWLANSAAHNPSFRWTMEGCGVEYAPLVVETSLSVALVAGVAVPCGALCVAAVAYLACCYGRRSNRTAPKDADVPFAMVFTDIQSSTSLWARAPEQMGDALEQHHEVLRRLVGRHDGYEVKTIGDSFMVAFKRASDAAAFGLEIQTVLFDEEWPDEIDDVYVSLAQEAYEEMLATEDPKKAAARAAGGERRRPQWDDEVNYPLNWNGIRVRVGLHWGVGSVKFDAVSQGYDYYGTLVNTAARVEGVGNGGQVLATRDLYARLEEEGFDLGSVDVSALGPQPLRGLDEPVPLYQLCPMGLRGREFAALRLDVENDATDDTATATNDDSHTHSSLNVDETPELMLARLVKRQRDSGPLYDHLLRVLMFMETLLRTSPMSWRKETMKTLMKKWHVHGRKPREKEPAERTLSFDIAALIGRVGVAAEEARRVAGGTMTNGTKTDAASSSAGSHVGRRGRRASRDLPKQQRKKSFQTSVVSATDL
jgi:class 3 adenylate cyclase